MYELGLNLIHGLIPDGKLDFNVRFHIFQRFINLILVVRQHVNLLSKGIDRRALGLALIGFQQEKAQSQFVNSGLLVVESLFELVDIALLFSFLWFQWLDLFRTHFVRIRLLLHSFMA